MLKTTADRSEVIKRPEEFLINPPPIHLLPLTQPTSLELTIIESLTTATLSHIGLDHFINTNALNDLASPPYKNASIILPSTPTLKKTGAYGSKSLRSASVIKDDYGSNRTLSKKTGSNSELEILDSTPASSLDTAKSEQKNEFFFDGESLADKPNRDANDKSDNENINNSNNGSVNNNNNNNNSLIDNSNKNEKLEETSQLNFSRNNTEYDTQHDINKNDYSLIPSSTAESVEDQNSFIARFQIPGLESGAIFNDNINIFFSSLMEADIKTKKEIKELKVMLELSKQRINLLESQNKVLLEVMRGLLKPKPKSEGKE